MSLRTWSATCAIVLGVSVGILAQDAAAPQTPSKSASAAKTITVTGCVAKAQQAPSAPTGTAGAAGAAATEKETKFVLSGAAITPSATAGTAGTTPPTTSVASEYRLDGDDAKLTPHVGHKVEITGSVDEPKGATQAPAASAANSPKLKVDNLKMVAPSCQ